LVTLAETKTEFNNWISEDATVSFLEKAQAGKTTLEDIADALDEFKRLHEAGLASPAEVITLARAYPSNKTYTEAADGLDEDETTRPMVVGGPASVELVDREGHLITTMALKKAFKKFMKNFRARNVMVMHSDVQVGHALPAYISKSGNIFKSGVDENGLFFISELRGDTKISTRVRDQIEKGGMSSYSIAGSATKSKDIKKSDGSNVLQVDDMELAEVTICEKGVNQGAHFELLKGDKASGSCVDGSCLTNHSEPTPSIQTEYIAIAKEDINHIDMFNNWISKAPMMAGAAGKMPKAITPPKPANVTGNIGMPVKMSMEKKAADDRLSQGSSIAPNPTNVKRQARAYRTKYGIENSIEKKINPFAIATAMAKKKGFKNFSDDSKGDKYRDKITEGIKETYNMKKEFLSKQEPKQPKKQKSIGAAASGALAGMGRPSEQTAKIAGKMLSRAGLGRSGKGRGTTGATRRALGAIGRSASAKRTAGGIGTARKKKFADLRRTPSGRPAGPKVKPQTKRTRTSPSGRPIPPRPTTSRGSAKQNLLARRGQQGTPTKLGDIPKGKPQKLTAPKSVTKGDIMDNVSNIVKQVFKSQVWDIVNERWVSKDVLPPVKRPKKDKPLTAQEQQIADLQTEVARLKDPYAEDLKRIRDRQAVRERQKQDRRREAQRSAPTPDTTGPAAERERLAESAAARERKFTPPKPVGMGRPTAAQSKRGGERDYEAQRQAARKNLGAMQSEYARRKERAAKGQTLATTYDAANPAGSAGRPSAPKAPKTTSKVSVPKKVAGSGMEEQRMRRTGTTRPSAPAPKKEPTAMQRAASFKGKGTVKPPKTVGEKPMGGTTTTKLSGTKPSASKPQKKTMAQRGRGPGGAAAALAANREEIARRQAARKLAGGGATRQTEQG